LFAEGEQAADEAPGGYELAMTQGGRIAFAELAEDELLLALPLVAMHGEGNDCVAQPAAAATPEKAPTQHPFAGLRAMMKDR
jgi:uncharacterized metal-binding protein YceD (DUF177 family)